MLSGPAALLAGLESGIRQIFNDLVSGSFFHFEANLKVDNSIKLTSFLNNMLRNTKEIITRASGLPFAETYPACKADLLEEYIELLTGSGHGWSNEIAEFLKISNGFFYNGIYVYSLGSDETPEHMDMVAANLQWDIPERLPGCIMFGRSDEEVYVYNQPEDKFQILDLTGWDEYYAFNTMNELLEFVISERI